MSQTESPGLSLGARGRGDFESRQGMFVPCAPAQQAENALAPTLSGKARNTFLYTSPRKWCLLVRRGS